MTSADSASEKMLLSYASVEFLTFIGISYGGYQCLLRKRVILDVSAQV